MYCSGRFVGNAEVIQKFSRCLLRETGFAEMNGDLPEADFWPVESFRHLGEDVFLKADCFRVT